MFYREEKKTRIVVRGDDFTAFEPKESLDWLRRVIQSRVEVKFKAILERGSEGVVRILNRIVTVTARGHVRGVTRGVPKSSCRSWG